jgi:hypothetical protein
VKNHRTVAFISISLALFVALPAYADEQTDRAVSGFYGGVALRERGAESAGLAVGAVNSVWGRHVPPVADESSPRALVFAGYRWRNDVAVEAAFNSTDMYALRPADAIGAGRGVGLSLAPSAGLAEIQARSWNVDILTSWTFLRAFALYGRLGYGQSEAIPGIGAAASAASEVRRLRDGVNYGLGVRYDMNPALGLRVEYGRFGRFTGEVGTGSPDADQVSVGVQLRF